jgi:cytochrome P450
MIFFLAGFETVTRFICFLSHELGVNPEVQEKLRAEIMDVKSQLNGRKLTYEDLQQMKYMDMVISGI